MRARHRCAKWLLLLTCLIVAICLIQRAAVFQQSLTGVVPVSQGFKSVPMAGLSEQPESGSGPSACQLSALSLPGVQPLFFDGSVPAVLLLLLLLTPLFFELYRERFRDRPVPIPLIRIHLKNCVFRE